MSTNPSDTPPPAEPEVAATADSPAMECAQPQAAEDMLQSELAQWRDLALRSQADFDNYRKRTAREIGEIRRFANGELLADLLPVLDNFDLGLQAARAESTESAIFLGMSMVRRQLEDFLSAQGVKEVPAEGQIFDPAKHDAVATEAHDGIPDGTIVRVARKGYFLHDRVLRAPSVVVSSGPARDASPETETPNEAAEG